MSTDPVQGLLAAARPPTAADQGWAESPAGMQVLSTIHRTVRSAHPRRHGRRLQTPFDEVQPRIQRPRRTTRRILAMVAAVSVGTASLLAVQGVGGSDSAYASWTATPTAVSVHDLAVVTRACRTHLAQYIDDNADAMRQEEMSGVIDAQTVAVGLAERRGDFVAVQFSQTDPSVDAPCVATNPPGSDDVSEVAMSFGWSNGPAATAHGSQLFEQSVAQFGDAPASFATGSVGADVAAVTIHGGARTVQATVSNGHYAAWWPGTAYTTTPDAVLRISLRFDLTLHDGRTLLNITANH